MDQFEIIIVNWNGLEYLRTCLQSLEQQTLKGFRITVVDNGSTDGSTSWIRENHPSVNCIALKENTGFASPNNLAAAQSQSDFLLLLNNDVEVTPTFFEAIVDGLNRHPEADMAAVTMIQHHDRSKIDNLGMDWTWAGVPRQRFHGAPIESISREEPWIFGPSGGAGVYRTSLFKSLGGFDDSFFAYCEDSDLNLRARTAGARCIFLPKAICYHHGSATGQRMSRRKYYLIHRNQSFSFFKNIRSAHLGRFVLPYLAYCLFRGAEALFKGTAGDFIRAKIDAFRRLRGKKMRHGC